MIDAVAELPNDVETLKAMLLAARAETAALTAEASTLAAEAATLRAAKVAAETRIERLHALLKTLERARYGRGSETLNPDQHEFAFEEIQTGLGAIEAALDAVAKTPQVRSPRPRKKLPAHLERIEVVIEPEATCGACGSGERVKIGEDVSERLDVIPARFRVIVTRRPRYACAACREGVTQAPASAHLIEAGIPTEALLAHIAVPNTPTACRFIGKRRSSPESRSTSVAISWPAGWAGSAFIWNRSPSAYCITSVLASASLPMRPRCQRWNPAPARRRSLGYGPTPATTGRSAAPAHRWWHTGSRIVAAAIVRLNSARR
jgi:hypothetical protein